jgi:UDP-glucose 4-epimerase
VGDVADAVFKSVQTRPLGEFNIGTAKETTIVEIAQELQKRACPTAAIEFGPAKPGEQLRSVIDNSLALKTFGWKPTMEMAPGLDQTLAWYRAGTR